MGRPLILLSLALFVVALTSAQNTKGSRKPSGGKIVGGSTTTIEQYPYQVGFEKWDQHFCGGSIISAYHILSAAHCFDSNRVDRDMRVRVGSSMRESGGTVYNIAKVLRHPSYNDRTKENDIAIVTLSQPITTRTGGRAIPLSKNEPADGGNIVITGWGHMRENGVGSRQLQVVEVPKVSQRECSRSYGTLSDKMWCAGMPNGGKDACQGDSGGPAVHNKALAGIVSFGVGCARPGYPGVYAAVHKYLDWIQANTK